MFTGKTVTVLERVEADIIFLDPPYELENEYTDALDLLGTRNAGLVIAQHAAKVELAKAYGKLQKSRVVKQGDNSLSFFTC